MSESTDPDFNLELHFLPSWAQKPADAKRYSNYEGENEHGGRRPRRSHDRQGQRSPRPRRDQGPGASSARDSRENRGPRRGGSGPQRHHRDQQNFQPAPLPDLNVTIVPDDHGVDSLTKQIRMTGRAYPLFEIARMVLQKAERYSFAIAVQKAQDGQPKQPLLSCAIDESVWLSEDAAVRHVLDKHFDLFYQAERTQIEAPKGTYTFVAQCGISGVILGPPNYHDYQKNLRDLHAKRFSKMAFEAFKSRVKIVKDEEVVKKWLEEKSFATEYNCLNLPEPLKLSTREDVEKHFRETHLMNVVRGTETVRIKGAALAEIRVPALARLLRVALEDQRRFPLQVVTVLSQQFASRGLQFFKVNKSVTHVSVARPHYLDLDITPVSDSIKRIVKFIDEHKGTTRKELIDHLAPSTTPISTASTPAEGVQESAPTEQKAAATLPSDVTAVIADLHWLVHEGHVIEFATGTLETAKRPQPRPAKPVKAKDKKESEETAPAPNQDTGQTPPAAASTIAHSPSVAVERTPEMPRTAPAPTPGPTTESTVSNPAEPSSSTIAPVASDQSSEANNSISRAEISKPVSELNRADQEVVPLPPSPQAEKNGEEAQAASPSSSLSPKPGSPDSAQGEGEAKEDKDSSGTKNS